jgi:poly [ADP-ribose] polymerase
MAPATRGKRAAQSPPTDAEPAPAKQPRKTNARGGKAKVEPVDEDQIDNSEPEAKKPAPRKGRSKAAVKAEPEDDEQDDVAEAKPAPKKGKAKAAAPKAESAEPEDKKPAPKKARGKAKVKDEPAEDEQVDSTEPAKDEKKPEIKEAQLAKKGTSQIPLDDGCYLTGFHVYVDNDNMIYDASLNQTNSSGNNNKFYRVQVSRIICANLE